MASKYWLKLYHEILDDPKMGMMPDRLWRRTIEIFLLAGEYDQDGLLPPIEQAAWRLRISKEECNETFQELLQCNILTCNGDGEYTVTNFEKRQSASSSTERVQQFRQRKTKKPDTGGQNGGNQGQNDDNSPQNGLNPVTEGYTPRNESETKRYTDTDTESDSLNKNKTRVRERDFLTDIVGHEKGKEGVANPADDFTAHFGYRDEALKICHELTGVYPDTQVGKPAIVALAQEAGFSLDRWRNSIRSARLGGVKANNYQCFIDTYRAGGDYRSLFKQRQSAGARGQPPAQSSEPSPVSAAFYAKSRKH